MEAFKLFSMSHNDPLIIFNFNFLNLLCWVLGEFLSSLFQSSGYLFSYIWSRTSPICSFFNFKYWIFSFPGFLIVPLSYPLTLVHFFPHLLRILNMLILQSFSSCSTIFFSSGNSISPADCFCWQFFFTLVFLFLFCFLFTEDVYLLLKCGRVLYFPLFHMSLSLERQSRGRLRAQFVETAHVQILAPWLNSCTASGRFLHLSEPHFPRL